MGWPRFEYAREPPFCGRGELEVRNIVARVHIAPLRGPSEVVPRIYAAIYARVRVVRALDVLADAAAGRWATIISPSGRCPAHVRPSEESCTDAAPAQIRAAEVGLGKTSIP